MPLLEQRQGSVSVREVSPGKSLETFIDLAWRFNAKDPCWVPPLRMAVRGALNRAKHPFHQHADVAYFIAYRGNQPVGRIAAIQNHRHNEYHNDLLGFFGLFECENDPDTARALVDAAREWLSDRGRTRIIGPFNFSTNDEISSPGVLIHGHQSRPTIMMSHNPAYYGGLLEAAGLTRSREMVAFWFPDASATPSRGAEAMDRLLARYEVTIRPLNMKRFQADVDSIKEVYNSAWSRNWGFVPMTDAEFQHLAKEFRPIVDPDLCLIAEAKGQPVGFSLTVPDFNQALGHLPDGRLHPWNLVKLLWYRRKINSMRVMTLGFKPQYRNAGLGPAFYIRTWKTGVSKGFTCGEGGWVLDINHEMMRPLERMGGEVHRRYAVYEGLL